MKICLIIPIKHKSTRVPGKNFRLFNGIPLFEVILQKVLNCKCITNIVIDTNSDIVKNTLKEKYKNTNIILYDRPEHLWDGDTPTNVLLENVINDLNLDYDFYLQTHVTNPLLKISTIENCISKYIDNLKLGYDSLFTVKQLKTRLYKNNKNKVEALNHNPNELIPTQDLEPLFEENSCLYIFTKSTLINRKHRIGNNPYMYIMDDIESSDIDIETDFLIAEVLHKQFEKQNNKLVLITGCNGGIGIELCKKFKNQNWIVVGTSRNENNNNKYLDFFIQQDLLEKDSGKNIILKLKEKYSKLDCIVNNAAIQICKPFHEYNENDWNNTYKCNIQIIQELTKYSLDLLKKSKGNIVNIGSVHSIVTSENISCYASTKACMVGLTKNMAIDLAKYNIRVNCISPGAVDTQMLRDGLLRGHVGDGDSDLLVRKLGEKHLLGNVGKPFEIANIVEFIANNDNGEFINGSNILIDGGASIKLSTE